MPQPIPLLLPSATRGAHRPETLAAYAAAVERVLHAMRANVCEPLSLDEMAEIACLSPFHFNRVFRALVGLPPGEFLAALRLDMAKRLLLTTSLRATDVCFELGYSSMGTFATRFKRLVGLSPRQLRHLAAECAPAPLPSAQRPPSGTARDPRLSLARPVAAVRATVNLPDLSPVPFAGLIFVGLFPRPIPQGRPVACATLAAPGPVQLGPVPDGTYYLLGAALPKANGPLAYLMPDAGMLVGVAPRPVTVRAGRASASAHLALRQPQPADPPILGVFPPLLATPAAQARLLA